MTETKMPLKAEANERAKLKFPFRTKKCKTNRKEKTKYDAGKPIYMKIWSNWGGGH